MHPMDELWTTIESRRGTDPEESWTARMISRGPEKCAEKFGEESIEALIEAVKGDRNALIRESADVLYHFCIMLASRGIALDDVWAELASRKGTSGLAEKAARRS
ncbi:phosphoribosyl-ATP diphosphatase [Jannaschia sp. S6380]|uniref:phosphoribosyl-ATP diphosphatase n=1 Tax=Jannaschia sp. S6380 TaxID=2926408 RepID=UPI001FF2A0DE|nr:phosphoribosyl-ATP diphosphatase [Jannaschia sp. S6380]MCK0167398.1 phosphoribosyl-ATP diphosphatase [Jannaschia sp. S6380]